MQEMNTVFLKPQLLTSIMTYRNHPSYNGNRYGIKTWHLPESNITLKYDMNFVLFAEKTSSMSPTNHTPKQKAT